MDTELIRLLVIAGTIVFGTIVPAFCIGWIGSTAVKAISRNPEAGSKIQTTTVLTAAFAEAIGIYALVVALSIKFVQ